MATTRLASVATEQYQTKTSTRTKKRQEEQDVLTEANLELHNELVRPCKILRKRTGHRSPPDYSDLASLDENLKDTNLPAAGLNQESLQVPPSDQEAPDREYKFNNCYILVDDWIHGLKADTSMWLRDEERLFMMKASSRARRTLKKKKSPSVGNSPQASDTEEQDVEESLSHENKPVGDMSHGQLAEVGTSANTISPTGSMTESLMPDATSRQRSESTERLPEEQKQDPFQLREQTTLEITQALISDSHEEIRAELDSRMNSMQTYLDEFQMRVKNALEGIMDKLSEKDESTHKSQKSSKTKSSVVSKEKPVPVVAHVQSSSAPAPDGGGGSSDDDPSDISDSVMRTEIQNIAARRGSVKNLVQ